MRPKERFLAAMRFKKPDDFVAFMELEFQIYGEYTGKSPIVGFEFAKLSAAEKRKALYGNAEIFVEVAEKAGHDVIKDLNWYWEVSPGVPAYLWLPDEQARLDQIKAIKRIAGDRFFILGTAGGIMGIPDGEHIDEYVIQLYENPGELKEKSEKMLAVGIEQQERVLESGADGVLLPCDVAFNNGPFISPRMMDEFFFPYFNRWVENLKKHGVVSIWHTDGNILPIMDRVIESGVTAIQCVDPLGGMDIVALKKQVEGKLALIGNINCATLQLGPADTIAREVKKVVEGCKGNGGFALSGCNAIFKGIPAEHYQVMVESRWKYGKETIP